MKIPEDFEVRCQKDVDDYFKLPVKLYQEARRKCDTIQFIIYKLGKTGEFVIDEIDTEKGFVIKAISETEDVSELFSMNKKQAKQLADSILRELNEHIG